MISVSWTNIRSSVPQKNHCITFWGGCKYSQKSSNYCTPRHTWQIISWSMVVFTRTKINQVKGSSSDNICWLIKFQIYWKFSKLVFVRGMSGDVRLILILWQYFTSSSKKNSVLWGRLHWKVLSEFWFGPFSYG